MSKLTRLQSEHSPPLVELNKNYKYTGRPPQSAVYHGPKKFGKLKK
jgi:hypothetical protein